MLGFLVQWDILTHFLCVCRQTLRNLQGPMFEDALPEWRPLWECRTQCFLCLPTWISGWVLVLELLTSIFKNKKYFSLTTLLLWWYLFNEMIQDNSGVPRLLSNCIILWLLIISPPGSVSLLVIECNPTCPPRGDVWGRHQRVREQPLPPWRHLRWPVKRLHLPLSTWVGGSQLWDP